LQTTSLYSRSKITNAHDYSNTKKEFLPDYKFGLKKSANFAKFQFKKVTLLEDKLRCTKLSMLWSKRKTKLSLLKESVELEKLHSQRKFAIIWCTEIPLKMVFCMFQCTLFYKQVSCIKEFLKKCKNNQIEVAIN